MTPASVQEAVVKVRSEPQGAIGATQRRLRQAVRAWLTIAKVLYRTVQVYLVKKPVNFGPHFLVNESETR